MTGFVKLKRPPTVAEEIKRRADVLAELIVHGPLPPNPWLMPELSESEMRRMVARLRAGITASPDPAVSASQFADEMEEQVNYRRFVRTVGNELDALQKMFDCEYKGLVAMMRTRGYYSDPENPFIPLRDTLRSERNILREERAELARKRKSRPRRKRKRA